MELHTTESQVNFLKALLERFSSCEPDSLIAAITKDGLALLQDFSTLRREVLADLNYYQRQYQETQQKLVEAHAALDRCNQECELRGARLSSLETELSHSTSSTSSTYFYDLYQEAAKLNAQFQATQAANMREIDRLTTLHFTNRTAELQTYSAYETAIAALACDVAYLERQLATLSAS